MRGGACLGRAAADASSGKTSLMSKIRCFSATLTVTFFNSNRRKSVPGGCTDRARFADINDDPRMHMCCGRLGNARTFRDVEADCDILHHQGKRLRSIRSSFGKLRYHCLVERSTLRAYYITGNVLSRVIGAYHLLNVRYLVFRAE